MAFTIPNIVFRLARRPDFDGVARRSGQPKKDHLQAFYTIGTSPLDRPRHPEFVPTPSSALLIHCLLGIPSAAGRRSPTMATSFPGVFPEVASPPRTEVTPQHGEQASSSTSASQGTEATLTIDDRLPDTCPDTPAPPPAPKPNRFVLDHAFNLDKSFRIHRYQGRGSPSTVRQVEDVSESAHEDTPEATTSGKGKQGEEEANTTPAIEFDFEQLESRIDTTPSSVFVEDPEPGDMAQLPPARSGLDALLADQGFTDIDWTNIGTAGAERHYKPAA
ncbi:hypothetical protein B0H63DRAFT_536542 [Podospora didyma]|uniref:Uncharacterized protein n=1 Tax=Podospora didyma TaxID=330526 RepID=A0AAE0JY31_9PEZI|nr:hypothetical protein B0H63DRAFT_536542 [Podospora didyma]